MNIFTKGSAGWFAICVGFLYFFIITIGLICLPLMFENDSLIFLPNTICGWIVFLIVWVFLLVVPFVNIAYVILLIIDKIANNKKIHRLTVFKKISLTLFLLVAFLNCIYLAYFLPKQGFFEIMQIFKSLFLS